MKLAVRLPPRPPGEILVTKQVYCQQLLCLRSFTPISLKLSLNSPLLNFWLFKDVMYTVERRALVQMIPVKRAVFLGCLGPRCVNTLLLPPSISLDT